MKVYKNCKVIFPQKIRDCIVLTDNGKIVDIIERYDGDHKESQDAFINNEKSLLIATKAFGMGIDKPDVRFVVHFDVPDSPEAYFQEAGRGGRDGKRSFAVLLWNSSDVKRMRQIATVSFPSLDYVEDIYHKAHIFFDIICK